MHVTGGTLQLEQTELTATQLDTYVARSGKKRKRKLRRFSRQCPSCLQPSQVTKLKGCICCMLGLGMFCSRCQGLHFFPPYFKGASMPAKVVAPRLPNRGASVQLDILGGPADPGNAIGEGEILESQRCFHSSPFFSRPIRVETAPALVRARRRPCNSGFLISTFSAHRRSECFQFKRRLKLEEIRGASRFFFSTRGKSCS